jgi:hypothetical protein
MLEALIIILILLGISSAENTSIDFNQTIAGKEVENNNNTIVVDDFLNFTWSTDLVASSKLFGLVPMPKGEEEDSMVKVLTGHFELNLDGSDMLMKATDSLRFCI